MRVYIVLLLLPLIGCATTDPRTAGPAPTRQHQARQKPALAANVDTRPKTPMNQDRAAVTVAARVLNFERAEGRAVLDLLNVNSSDAVVVTSRQIGALVNMTNPQRQSAMAKAPQTTVFEGGPGKLLLGDRGRAGRLIVWPTDVTQKSATLRLGLEFNHRDRQISTESLLRMRTNTSVVQWLNPQSPDSVTLLIIELKDINHQRSAARK